MASIRKIAVELKSVGELDENAWATLKKRIRRLWIVVLCFIGLFSLLVFERLGFFYAIPIVVLGVICGVTGYKNIQRLCEFYNFGEITDAKVTWAHLSHRPNAGRYFDYKYNYTFLVKGKTYKKQHRTLGVGLYREQHPTAGEKIRALYLNSNPDKCVPYYESQNARYNLRIGKEFSYLVPPLPITRKAVL